MRARIVVALSGVALLVVLVTGPAAADPGDLDALFGNGGIALSSPSGSPYSYPGDVVVQPDGKVLVAGDCLCPNGGSVLVRYLPGGSLDPNFGHEGIVSIALPSSTNGGSALALLPDGRILVGGDSGVAASSQTSFTLWRFQSNGSLDTSFGTGGFATTKFGADSSHIDALAVQSDGKIDAAGGVANADGTGALALVRYQPEGSLDTSFGTQGKVLTSTSDVYPGASALALQADGKLIVGGPTDVQPSDARAIYRYQPSGALDKTFGTGGKVTTPTNVAASGVAIQTDGKIVVVGGGAARYNPGGSLDQSFGSGGIVSSVGAGTSAYEVALEPDGDIVTGGFADNGNGLFAVARLKPDGSHDSSFGNAGLVTTGFGPPYQDVQLTHMALLPDGRILVDGFDIGYTGDEDVNERFALAQYTAGGSLDPTFGDQGRVTTNVTGDDVAEAVAALPDGRVVTAGYSSLSNGRVFTLEAFDGQGTDPSFPTVTTSFGSSGALAYAVTGGPNGEIVAAGDSMSGSAHHIAIARYDSGGSPESSFGTGGKVVNPLATVDGARGVALQSGGKVLVAGTAIESGGLTDFLVARYNPDGSLDSGFGSDGVVRTSFVSAAYAHAIAVQPDGRIVVAGRAGSDVALARYTAGGSLDTSFGSGGKVVGPPGAATALALQPDGKIVVGGSASDAFAVLRYTPGGMLDGAFGSDGQVTTAIGASSTATSVALQPNGKIVAAGWSENGSPRVFAVARYLPDGSLDTAFSSGGTATATIGALGAEANGVAIPTDGSIFVAGSSRELFDNDVAVARYLGDSYGLGVKKTGTGAVESRPAGIQCGPTCSGVYAAQTQVTLSATPSKDSEVSWGGDCTGTARTCTLTMDRPHTVTVEFARCVVPHVKHRALARAMQVIRRHDCSIGNVSRRFSSTVRRGLVLAQRPRAGTAHAPGFAVRLVVSKGKRR
jgi:uncharacterized delta-60 repeat protein